LRQVARLVGGIVLVCAALSVVGHYPALTGWVIVGGVIGAIIESKKGYGA
jgi:hypothetical protein